MAGTALIADNDITVTSATQTEDAVRAHFESPAEKPAAEGTPADKKVDAPAKDGEKKDAAASGATGDDDALKAEADSNKPDEQVSEAARTLRRSRFDERRKQKQTEIDGLTKTAGELKREVEALQRQAQSLRRPTPPAVDDKSRAAAEPASRRESAAPEFKFPTFEEWQGQDGNDGKSFSDYTDARTDARYDFNERQRADRVQRERAAESAATLAREFKTHEDDYRTAHPEYDDALNAVSLSDDQLASPQFRDMKGLIAQAGKHGPAIMHHLAKSPEDLAACLGARSRADLLQEFGAIKRTVVKAGTAAPAGDAARGDKAPAADPDKKAAAPPPKPTSSAPAPVTPVAGSAAPGRSLASLAEDSEDADAYIEARGHGKLLKR